MFATNEVERYFGGSTAHSCPNEVVLTGTHTREISFYFICHHHCIPRTTIPGVCKSIEAHRERNDEKQSIDSAVGQILQADAASWSGRASG